MGISGQNNGQIRRKIAEIGGSFLFTAKPPLATSPILQINPALPKTTNHLSKKIYLPKTLQQVISTQTKKYFNVPSKKSQEKEQLDAYPGIQRQRTRRLL